MPNWCSATVTVNGKTEKDVTDFCKHFVYKEDEDKDINRKIFNRSFTHTTWSDFLKDYEDNLSLASVTFVVDFANSASGCLLDEEIINSNCLIGLVDACKQHRVSVVIDSEEPMMCFEEHIECDEEGRVVEEVKDMPTWICEDCGNEQSMPSSCDVSCEACYECEKEGHWRKKK